ncbi:MAG: cytochrome c [Caldilineaceae bacterium]
MSATRSSWQRLLKRSVWVVGPLLIILVMVACQPIQPAPAAQSQPAPTATAVASSASVTTTAATTATTATTATMAMQGDPKNGAYIVALDFGCGCHLNRDLGGLAGGNTFTVTEGFAYARNITPDKDTGIGNWTPEQIAKAITTGAAERDGKTIQLHPVMPYKALSVLSKQEALDVAAYLLAQKPIANQVKPRELKSDPASFTPAQAAPDTPPTDPVARGKQLVLLTNCNGCHTPKNKDGSPMTDMMLAGAPLRGSEVAANITPDEETGIGKWTEEQIADFMYTGKLPDGKQIEGAMAQQIQRRFSKLTEADAKAIAAFLKSIPAVKNEPKPAQ